MFELPSPGSQIRAEYTARGQVWPKVERNLFRFLVVWRFLKRNKFRSTFGRESDKLDRGQNSSRSGDN